MVGDTRSDRGKNQGHITKTQITEIVHALSLAVNVFLNLSAMNFENYSTTLTNFSISLNAKKKKKNQYVITPGVDYHFQRNKCFTLENILCTNYNIQPGVAKFAPVVRTCKL